MKLFVRFLFLSFCTILNVLSKEDSLSDKTQQLTEWALKKSVIRFTTERFNQYVKSSPRNYSIIIMFTAMAPQRQCGICKQAQDEYQLVAETYRYSNSFSNKVFFGVLDFDEGAEVFQSLKLNSAPVFIHFPARMKPKKSDQMDIGRWGFSAEKIAKWVHDRTDITISISRPPNYSRVLMIGFSVILLTGLLYVKRNSLGFFYNYIFWGISVIFIILSCISGQIWNYIRAPALVHRNQKTGQSGFFSGSSGYQFLAETYVVFSLYFGVSIGMILLNEAPKIKSNTGKRKALVAILGIVMVISLFSYILSIFRSKYQGYPYSFLFK